MERRQVTPSMLSLQAHPIWVQGRGPIHCVCVVPSLGAFSPLVRVVRMEPRFRASRPHPFVVNLTTPRSAQMGHVGTQLLELSHCKVRSNRRPRDHGAFVALMVPPFIQVSAHHPQPSLCSTLGKPERWGPWDPLKPV